MLCFYLRHFNIDYFTLHYITLCTSGFMDDVIFAHKPRLFDVATQLKRSAHAALGLASL